MSRTATLTAPPVLAFDVSVAAVQDLSPSFRRITFRGGSLRQFGVQGPTLDLRIKIMIPSRDAAGAQIPLPSFGDAADGAVELGDGWYQRWLAMDPAARGAMRTYTVRTLRPGTGGREPELDVDFVLHFDADGTGGPASSWAAGAVPGDAVVIIGPNLAAAVPAGYGGIEFRPGPASHLLLAGDETAVPAIAAILASLPAAMTGTALLEVPAAADFQELESAADIRVSWLARGGRPHGELLAAAVRRAVVPGSCESGTGPGAEPEDINVDEVILWETTAESSRPFYAWLAGEAAVIRGLRRYLVGEAGTDRKQVAFMGYWRAGKAEL